MIFEKYLLSKKFVKSTPILSITYYFKTIGDCEYSVYIFSEQIRIFIYDINGDEKEIKDFFFTTDAINFIDKVIRQAKIKSVLQCQKQ